MRSNTQAISIGPALILGAIAAGAYGVAFAIPSGAAAILVALPCLLLLSRMRTARRVFYVGLLIAIGIYAPHLFFFWKIFHAKAILLWIIAGFPLAMFLLLLHLTRLRLGEQWAMWLAPVLWMGIEYFRSEAYFLKFSWILPGQAVAFVPGVRLLWIGVYGLGFIMVMAAAMAVNPRRAYRITGIFGLVALGVAMYLPPSPAARGDSTLHLAGVQLEGADASVISKALEHLAAEHPEAQILVLSEYTFSGPVPRYAREIARRYRRYLIAGGIRDAEGEQFYDTAFVIGPDGKDLFEQGKSVPVQFTADGLPAEKRQVWDSKWGRIGIAVCYDVGYAQVMDDFVRQGAQGLIVPTMDMTNWGNYERRMLHGRLAPVRAAEYGIPVFGVWSSGVSQLTDRNGQVIAKAGYPGQGESLAGPMDLKKPGRIPPDRWPARVAMWGTLGLAVLLMISFSPAFTPGERTPSTGVPSRN